MTLFEQLKKDRKKPFDLVKLSIYDVNSVKWVEYEVMNIPDELLFKECVKKKGTYIIDLTLIYDEVGL